MMKLKLWIIGAAMVGCPILFYCFDVNETFAFFATIFIELFLGCWGISVVANEANKYFDH